MEIDNEIAKQFHAMGVEVTPNSTPVPEETEGFEVLPQNWNSLRAFLACDTQWRAAAGMAGLIWLGLDYAGVDIALTRLGFGDEAFADVQLMEITALEVFGEVQT